MKVCIYLRKSREDIEAEKQGQGETLAKHRNALLKIAKERNYNIINIYEEVVSGENISSRPMMQKMLNDVESKYYEAVLVMDIDRLGRGKLQDQGLILDTFKNSSTLIITPRKTYDLNNEFDEEYSEFESFMARKEYKMINRRMQGGRVRSVESGNFIGTLPPFGYKIEYTGKERRLVPDGEHVETIRMIYDLYINGNGCSKIKNHLNSLGLKSCTGIDWSSYSVISTLKNPIYAGFVRWKAKDKCTVAKGKHEPIISEVTYKIAMDILEKRYHVPFNNKVTNPLAGLVICKMCGYSMVLRPTPDRDNRIMCYKNCGNRSTKISYVEDQIIEWLEYLLKDYKTTYPVSVKSSDTLKTLKKQKKEIENELLEVDKQKSSLHDFLELGVYDIETFKERSILLSTKIDLLNKNLLNALTGISEEESRIQATKNIIPSIEKALKLYKEVDNAEVKNKLLKELIDRVEYSKSKTQRDKEFDLDIYPKVDKL